MLTSGKISPEDIDLFHLTDDPGEAVQVIVDAHAHQARLKEEEEAAREAAVAGGDGS
jgi:tryptophanyl-tRNA synthetase